jgi:hypothetical protein
MNPATWQSNRSLKTHIRDHGDPTRSQTHV